jgi:hypothetical protein
MAEEKFSPEQSLKLIEAMIFKTKQNISDNSIYFLVWGWIAFIACTGQFILKHIYHYERHYVVWLLSFIGIAFTLYQGRKDEKKTRVTTYVGDSLKHLWLGMAISFFVLSLILTQMGWGIFVFPFYIMLYGLGTFVSGSIVQFRPLIIGGVLAFILAVGSTFASYDYQMLYGAGAVLVSYIIPAYMLRSKNRKLQ